MAEHDKDVIARIEATQGEVCRARSGDHVCYLAPGHLRYGHQRQHECGDDGEKWDPTPAELAAVGVR